MKTDCIINWKNQRRRGDSLLVSAELMRGVTLLTVKA